MALSRLHTFAALARSTHLLSQIRALHHMFEGRRGMYTCDLEDGESLEKYGPGGFHPVAIGDTFQEGRYKVIHKLGYGSFSTVWLARDVKKCHNVALKISVAHKTAEQHRESTVLRALEMDQQQAPGKQYIVSNFDTFQHRGPNGVHQVSIMELLGSSAAQAAACNFPDERLPSCIAREVAKQAALGISYLHKLSIAHGDVHPGNLVFAVPKLQDMSEQSVIKALGSPELFRVRRSNLGLHEEGVPRHLVGPCRALAMPDLSRHFEIRLVDFGNSFMPDNPPSNLVTPMYVRAPEVALGLDFDNRADLWSLGCTIFMLFSGAAPVNGFGNDRLIENMISTIGPLPQQWQGLYTPSSHSESTSYDYGEFDGDYDFQQWLEVNMFDEEKKTDLTLQQVQTLGCLIRKLVQYEPLQRSSAAKLASDPLWEELQVKQTWRNSLLRYLKNDLASRLI